jgi:hypothetical protein
MILTVRKPLPEDHLRRALRLVAVLNLAYFFVEFVVALAIGSVSPFADSIDFLEDTSVKLPYPRFSGLVDPMAGTCGKALRYLARYGHRDAVYRMAHVPIPGARRNHCRYR